MSTQPVTPSISPGVSKILSTFTTYATIAAATIQQEQADISKGDHVAAVSDAVTGVAAGLASAKTSWQADISASLALFQTFLPIFVGLFHHTKKVTPVTPTTQTVVTVQNPITT